MKVKEWNKLDNVGTFYASISKKKIPAMYRITVSMKDKVNDKDLLNALENTIKKYPNFHSTLRRGLFWYYMEESDTKASVSEDDGFILDKNYLDKTKLLYRVTYLDKRINLEVSHVLADGRGALTFFKDLINNYVSINKDISITSKAITSIDDVKEDTFDKIYKKTDKYKSNAKNVYHYKNIKLSKNQIQIFEVHTNAKKLKEIAHKYNTTINTLLLSILIYSYKDELKVRDYKKSIRISVPVDLRDYYNSKTIHNFFAMIYVTYKFEHNNIKLKDIIKSVSKQIEDNLKKDIIERRVLKMESFEHLAIARIFPLFIKNIFLSIVDKLTNNATTTLSNVNVPAFDKNVDKHIEYLSAITSTESYQFVAITNKNDLCIGITSRYKRNNIIKNFIYNLNDLDIDLTINTNEVKE